MIQPASDLFEAYRDVLRRGSVHECSVGGRLRRRGRLRGVGVIPGFAHGAVPAVPGVAQADVGLVFGAASGAVAGAGGDVDETTGDGIGGVGGLGLGLGLGLLQEQPEMEDQCQ